MVLFSCSFFGRFEETNQLSLKCKKDEVCIGGYARLVAVVRQLQRSRSNPIYFNAGDNYAGSIWYTLGKWNVTSHFLNLLPADVMVLLHCSTGTIWACDVFHQKRQHWEIWIFSVLFHRQLAIMSLTVVPLNWCNFWTKSNLHWFWQMLISPMNRNCWANFSIQRF